VEKGKAVPGPYLGNLSLSGYFRTCKESRWFAIIGDIVRL
jgi:hypothetical protein